MDAPNPSSMPTFANRTPLHIGAVGLKVRDIEGVTGFYRDVLGLAMLDRTNERTTLGAGGVALVHLEDRPDAAPDDRARRASITLLSSCRRAAISRVGFCTSPGTRWHSRAHPTIIGRAHV